MKHSVHIVEINKLKGHEQIDIDCLKALMSEIESDGVLKRPIVVDKKTQVVLDGHHRMKALSLIGCLKIPVCYVNYMSKKIDVKSTIEGLEITKSRVLDAALNKKPFPPKSTSHYLIFKNNKKHISYIQKRVDIPLKLLGLERHLDL